MKRASTFSFELFVAFRYLFSRRKETFIYVISLMSVLGVALGVGSLVVVLSVYNGFTTDIRDKLLGLNAHGVVLSASPGLFQDKVELLEKIRAFPGVTSATPYVYSEVMLSAPGGVKGLMLRGIETSSAAGTLTILSQIDAAVLERLDREDITPGIIIGQELAGRMGLREGSRVNLLVPSGQRGATGFNPSIKPFEVMGIFKSGLIEDETTLGFNGLESARRILGLPDGRISAIEIASKDVFATDTLAEKLGDVLGAPYYVRHWMEMNANLFAALKLEKIGMFILLAMVVLIGSFSIVATLVLLVMEKTRDIAIMMSMGATRAMIRRIFILQGTIIGVVGTLVGYVLGIGVSLLLKRYQFIKLPKGVYSLDHLPVILNTSDIIIIGVSACVLCFFATIYPARRASTLVPDEALRYE